MSDLPRPRAAGQIALDDFGPPVVVEETVVAIGEAPSPGRPIEIGPDGSIGRALREARLEAGLTTYEVAQTTRIRAGRLLELEDDDFASCGSSVLARGRLVAIARAVGVDPAPLLVAFDVAQADTAPSRVAPPAPQLRPSRFNWTRGLLWALGVVALYPFALLCAHVLG